MGFIKSNNGYNIGDIVVTARSHTCLAGTMEEGTIVKVIGMSERGYDIEDEEGNKVIEIGFII